MKFIESGIGNTRLVRTETEPDDGKDFEERGVRGPVKVKSVYMKLWIDRRVFIWDSD